MKERTNNKKENRSLISLIRYILNSKCNPGIDGKRGILQRTYCLFKGFRTELKFMMFGKDLWRGKLVLIK